MKNALLDYTLRTRIPLVVFVALLAFLVTYYLSRAERDGVGYAPVQPIAFSHKLHAGTMGIDCNYCHTAASTSASATVPAVSVCMNCHAVARKNRPEIIKLTRYFEEGIALPWKRVHRVPDYAYFNHSAHVNRGIECQQCHGRVQDAEVISQVSAFTMAACIKCHRESQQVLAQLRNIQRGPDYCNACHR